MTNFDPYIFQALCAYFSYTFIIATEGASHQRNFLLHKFFLTINHIIQQKAKLYIKIINPYF